MRFYTDRNRCRMLQVSIDYDSDYDGYLKQSQAEINKKIKIHIVV